MRISLLRLPLGVPPSIDIETELFLELPHTLHTRMVFAHRVLAH